jgi:hypothetical protein
MKMKKWNSDMRLEFERNFVEFIRISIKPLISFMIRLKFHEFETWVAIAPPPPP